MKMRLKKGKGYAGAEYFGCCNTGRRAVILRSRVTGTYLVGTELAVDSARNMVCYDVYRNQRTLKTSSGVVKNLKTSGAAWKLWNELNDKVLAYNEKAKAEVKECMARARRVEIGGALGLAEYL